MYLKVLIKKHELSEQTNPAGSVVLSLFVSIVLGSVVGAIVFTFLGTVVFTFSAPYYLRFTCANR